MTNKKVRTQMKVIKGEERNKDFYPFISLYTEDEIILEQLEKMQQTFMEDGLQGYEMVIVTAKNLINRLIQENKELKEKLQQYKKIEEIVNTITDDDIRNAIKNVEKDYIPKSKVKEKIEYHKKIDNLVAIMILEKLLE